MKLSHFLSAKGADSTHQDQFLNSVGQPIYLTRREMECARYLRVGKTAKGIGRILGLSARTVECYINHLKTKFKVHSKADLMEQLLKNS